MKLFILQLLLSAFALFYGVDALLEIGTQRNIGYGVQPLARTIGYGVQFIIIVSSIIIIVQLIKNTYLINENIYLTLLILCVSFMLKNLLSIEIDQETFFSLHFLLIVYSACIGAHFKKINKHKVDKITKSDKNWFH